MKKRERKREREDGSQRVKKDSKRPANLSERTTSLVSYRRKRVLFPGHLPPSRVPGSLFQKRRARSGDARRDSDAIRSFTVLILLMKR